MREVMGPAHVPIPEVTRSVPAVLHCMTQEGRAQCWEVTCGAAAAQCPGLAEPQQMDAAEDGCSMWPPNSLP